MKRPAIGSQIIRDSDPLKRVGVVINVTALENVFRYDDEIEHFEADVPFTYVGWSHPSKWHRLANVYRLFNAEELKDTVKSIKSSGLLFPIITWEGLILDGRNRMLACNLAGVEPRIETRTFDTFEDAARYVKATNSDRRQLSKEDRKQAAADLAEMLQTEREKRKRDEKGQLLPLASNEAASRSADIAGKAYGLSGATVERRLAARKQEQELIDKRPDLAEKVRNGEMSLRDGRIEAGFEQAPALSVDERSLEVSVGFSRQHLAKFKKWAKENEIAWHDLDRQAIDAGTKEMLKRVREGGKK